LLGSMNDFNALGESGSKFFSHLIGISFFTTAALTTIFILKDSILPESKRGV